MKPFLPGLPAKPREGERCNGCGLCCAMEVCAVGKIAYPGASAPCPGILIETDPDGTKRIRCEVVMQERQAGTPPLIQAVLGIGKGCDSDD